MSQSTAAIAADSIIEIADGRTVTPDMLRAAMRPTIEAIGLETEQLKAEQALIWLGAVRAILSDRGIVVSERIVRAALRHEYGVHGGAAIRAHFASFRG